MMLAQISPEMQQVGLWLAIVFFVAGGINQVSGMITRWRGQPPSEELKQQTDALKQRIETVEAFEKNCAAEQSRQRRVIYEKIECMGKEVGTTREDVAAMRGEMKMMQQQNLGMDAKLNRVLERLPHKRNDV